MWYDTIPVLSIVTICVFIPNAVCYVANKLINGNPFSRHISCSNFDTYMYVRDLRLSGNRNAHFQVGIDCLADVDDDTKPEAVEKKKCEEESTSK